MPVPTYEEAIALEEQKAKFDFEMRVRQEELKIVGQVLSKCYLSEGPNQAETCEHLRKRYKEMLNTHRMEGARKLDLSR